MTAPVILPPVAAPLPSQFTSKVDKKDQQRLQIGADSYVHGNEDADTSNRATVYDRHGNARRLRTRR